MNILLHTIALEPARWTLQRVSQNLADLISKIRRTRFKSLEIFEPHLTASDESAIKDMLDEKDGLRPVMLSSYLQVSPQNTDDAKFASDKKDLVQRVQRFGFEKVRLFPGGGVSPANKEAVKIVSDRIAEIAAELPNVQILLETHDGSIADKPEAIMELVEKIGLKNVGILWQPTIFKAEPAYKQFTMQKPLIRHIHLQNRHQDGSFSTLKEGIIPWDKILTELDVDVSLEFVPTGICTVDTFDVAKSLGEAVMEADYVLSLQAK